MILPDVIARLVTLFDSAVDAPVFDGPDPKAVKNRQFVVVGSSGEEGEPAGSIDLQPSTLGAGDWRDETGEIICSAWSHYGGSDIAARRAEALSLAEACIDAVHNDRTLGGLLNTPGATTSALTYEHRQEPTGTLIRVTFTVAYQALVTS